MQLVQMMLDIDKLEVLVDNQMHLVLQLQQFQLHLYLQLNMNLHYLLLYLQVLRMDIQVVEELVHLELVKQVDQKFRELILQVIPQQHQ